MPSSAERRLSHSFKALFHARPSFSRSKKSQSQAGSKGGASVISSWVNDPSKIAPQTQSPFFRLPPELRLQVYKYLIREEIYHFGVNKQLRAYRCPYAVITTKSGRRLGVECSLGHPWIARPTSIAQARAEAHDQESVRETRTAILQTCKLA